MPKLSSITDTTQLEMREVDSTGTLKSGEKALAGLRKRKLIAQKSVLSTFLHDTGLTVFESGKVNGSACRKGLITVHRSRNWKQT